MKSSDLGSSQKVLSLAGITALLSTGTLLCCALPILLVSLGLGAVVASIGSHFPVLIVLAEHKVQLFSASAAMLVISAWSIWRPGAACPTDPLLAQRCEILNRWSKRLFILSALLWAIGFSFAYLLLPLTIWLET